MKVKDFINELIIELSYRVNEGYPDFSKQTHINVLSDILDEWGLVDIKQELIQTLTEEEKRFKNSILNKSVTYTNAAGKEVSNIIGNLITLPTDSEGRKEAEKHLPKPGTPEREELNAEVGSQGKSDSEVEKEKKTDSPDTPDEKEPTVNIFGKGSDYEAPDLEKSKADSSNLDNRNQSRIVSGKDKTLKKIDSLKSPEFNNELEPSDSEFEIKNEKIKNPTPPPAYKLPESIKKNPKFPKKYLTALERMMNTKPTGEGTKWSHYSDTPGGAGQISAQAGELMSMMGTTMNDSDFKQFTESLIQHESELIKSNPKLKSESSRIVTKSWIKAAENNRQAIFNRIKLQYPNSEIIAATWDTENDAESLGLSDYKKNKGFSTDIFLKIKTSDGNEILDEISLKKSKNINFLNSGTGKFSEWDSNLPDIINQTVYRDKQRQNLTKYGEKFKSEIDTLLASGSEQAAKLKKVFESKNSTFSKALEDTKNGQGSREKSKVILESIKALADTGNSDASAYLEQVDTMHREFQKNAVNEIVNNEKLKNGMMKEIRSEFPLKSVSEGEETMAIGSNSLDKPVMKEIFGTDDYNKIKEKLSANQGPPPFLGYKAEVDGEIIPLAEIGIRENGVGYGGQFKFEMQLHKEFAKILKTANEKIYG